MTDPAPRPRRIGPLITAGVIFCLLTALAYAAWRTCSGPADRAGALSAQEPVGQVGLSGVPTGGAATAPDPTAALPAPS